MLRPYHIERSKNVYSFLTKNGIEYSASFSEVDYLPDSVYKHKVFAFNLLVNDKGKKKVPLDIRVKSTVTLIVRDFITSNNNSVVYMCDFNDERQTKRKIAFDRWFKDGNDGAFYKLGASYSLVLNEKRKDIYLELITECNNENFEEITRGFGKEVRDFSNK